MSFIRVQHNQFTSIKQQFPLKSLDFLRLAKIHLESGKIPENSVKYTFQGVKQSYRFFKLYEEGKGTNRKNLKGYSNER